MVMVADSSMMVLDRAVAAPIFDENRKVIGAIYGDRKFGSEGGVAPIGDLEAALLEVMAGVKAALAEVNDLVLNPQGLTLIQATDQTEYIDGALALLNDSVYVGAGLAMIVLLLFLRSVTSTLTVCWTTSGPAMASTFLRPNTDTRRTWSRSTRAGRKRAWGQ